jgi:signal transduction histidine kinase
MRTFASLTNRIFFATALLAIVTIAIAMYIVNVAVTRQAEGELQHGLEEAASLVGEYRALRFDHFANEARLVADLPKLKAAMDTDDPATVRDIANGYQQQLKADVFVIVRRGRLLARWGGGDISEADLMAKPGLDEASNAREATAFWSAPHGILQVVSVPVFIDRELAGALIVGVSLDSTAAARFKTLTNSEIVFGARGVVQAATIDPALWPRLDPLLAMHGFTPTLDLNGSEYIALAQPLGPAGTAGAPTVLVLRSRTEQLRFLRRLHALLGGIAVVALLGATSKSYAHAPPVTRPHRTITATMREMASTGDLTRRIPVPTDARWQDEDAHLLATTFNTMTDSIQRFQREASQRERLSSLGRLSTVVAHEIRNPLMIIKAALRGLRRADVPQERVQAAVRDIDEEIARLNRIVSEVLDFARPIKFDLAPADLNAVAADAVRAAAADGDRHAVRLGLDPRIPSLTTDADRLRQVLVNVLSNAVQAVDARPSAPSADPPIRLETHQLDGSHVVVTVRDRGVGIAPEHLPRVFDPYFTTRRTGTGIGLAISRNIIEGLGGRITVSSQVDRGTEVRIELPLQPTS